MQIFRKAIYQIPIFTKLCVTADWHIPARTIEKSPLAHTLLVVFNQRRDTCRYFNMRSCRISLFTTNCRSMTRALHDKDELCETISLFPLVKSAHTILIINLIGSFDNVQRAASKNTINFLSALEFIAIPASLNYEEL